ncbi:hypothetical protein Thena_0915 [Thermodesulfobium narugense DSM 14796]|uniref:Uncharacterized protein n=1 Tax=Thermodesulfobium narugense DSM 14796 TaxID=747365 RepID=M1E8L4_9BACT|nr:hypothetical protein [Thermodesulfobium narugense]AEE14544.1 hypothetical protein Thena_0915 [Thermodesulfobium narugense DSM 14796]
MKMLFYACEDPSDFSKYYRLFKHVKLLNESGNQAKIILECRAVLIPLAFSDSSNPLNSLYMDIRRNILGVCKTCAIKFNTFEHCKSEGLPIKGLLGSHIACESYIRKNSYAMYMFADSENIKI